MNKHTPGPWVFVSTPNDDDFSHEIMDVCALYRNGNPQRVADARLIAAAPDLLEALEYTLKCLMQTDVGEAHYQPAIAAIAKARGEA